MLGKFGRLRSVLCGRLPLVYPYYCKPSTRRGFWFGAAERVNYPKTHLQIRFPNRQDDCSKKRSSQKAIGTLTTPLSMSKELLESAAE